MSYVGSWHRARGRRLVAFFATLYCAGNERGGVLGASTYSRVWEETRQLALTTQQVASPLAGRPYDLRHAALSTWLNAGVDPATVAERAGNSVEVLLKHYAKCLRPSRADQSAHRSNTQGVIEAASRLAHSQRASTRTGEAP